MLDIFHSEAKLSQTPPVALVMITNVVLTNSFVSLYIGF